MIISFVLLLLVTCLAFNRADEEPPIGILNHNTTWLVHCPNSELQTIHPPLNDRAVVPYRCPSPSLPLDIVPIEIDFTFVCRSTSRLVWVIVDLYQFHNQPTRVSPQQLNVTLTVNQQIPVVNRKSETNQYNNRFIVTNAFYIPFESLDSLADQYVDLLVQINRCQFTLSTNTTWDDGIRRDCDSAEPKALQVQSGHCHFFPKLKPPNAGTDQNTSIPDFHVMLSINQPPTVATTTTSAPQDYHFSFDEHYEKSFLVLRRASSLIVYIFIFTTMTLILLIIFFLYTLCFHFHTRAARKSSLLI